MDPLLGGPIPYQGCAKPSIVTGRFLRLMLRIEVYFVEIMKMSRYIIVNGRL